MPAPLAREPHTGCCCCAPAELDVITRQDFLAYLKSVSDAEGVTVVYATHIFDGLDDWHTQ